MRFIAAMAFAGFAALGDPGPYGLLESIGGQPDCVAAAGDGKLTIGFDATGTVSVCRWPGPTAPNQITFGTRALSNHGAMWGIARGDTIEWLPRSPGTVRVLTDDGPAPVVKVIYESLGIRETAFVVPGLDIAVFQLQLAELPPEASLVWVSDFSPCTKNMEAVPASERFFAARRDLAAFEDKGTVYHVRPSNAGTEAWNQADAWLAGGDPPPWFQKGDGVWIGYSSVERIGDFVFGAETGDAAALKRAETGAWGRHEKAVGPSASAARISIDATGKTATVFVALGERKADVDDALATAREKGYAELLEETQQWWRERLAAARQPATAPANVVALYQRALRQLLVNVDSESGAIACAPLSSPPLAVDAPRLGAWTTLALDLVGESDAAEKHVRFLAQAVRVSDSGGAPAGSLPAALYGSGVDASPRAVLDVQAAAWLLWSIWQHDARVADVDRQRYRNGMWKTVELAGDFVSSQCRAARDMPIFSFDPARMSDTASIETVAIAFAGIRAADSLAKALDKDKPEWSARALELEDYLRFHALDAAGAIKTAEPLTLWQTGLIPAGDPRWAIQVMAACEGIRLNPGTDSLKDLAKVAMLIRDQGDSIVPLQPLVEPVVRRALDEYPCDSYYAALAVTVVFTIFNPK